MLELSEKITADVTVPVVRNMYKRNLELKFN
jgi:hypothetical protein